MQWQLLHVSYFTNKSSHSKPSLTKMYIFQYCWEDSSATSEIFTKLLRIVFAIQVSLNCLYIGHGARLLLLTKDSDGFSSDIVIFNINTTQYNVCTCEG